MSQTLRDRLFQELDSLEFVDPHTHIDARRPAATSLAEIMGYHYYTELAHSAGLPREQIEQEGLDPRAKVARLVPHLDSLQNTIQVSWLLEIAQSLLGFSDDRITIENWESLYDLAAERMAQPGWDREVLRRSKLKAVFLTNDFDDPLEGFDTQRYIPCLRTDDLVFHLARPDIRQRLEASTGIAAGDANSLRSAIGKLFERFCARDARACAISLPPDFEPQPISDAVADQALAELHTRAASADPEARQHAAHFTFWTLAQFCAEFGLPFDLMIGVNRGVYASGVYQGQDLYDSRVSMIQYQKLLNAFPQVTFPISVLASVTNQELVSYAWIFPNVVTNGHWWYSNTPAFIEPDLAARLEAVPQNKQIGYYSDMYKLEFALPKFNMYKRILAKVLAERFVIDRGWTEQRAVELGTRVLRDNTERIFPCAGG